ncbi:MAG TPA: P-loop NTPase [Solirubrobacteraceae bacterium]|jgi:Mrp family chromosome partitioning ATPase/LPS O-antigen subunit length determinant protein (WzzB/FepE family)
MSYERELPASSSASFSDQAVDVRRYFDALRGGWKLILGIAVTVTVLVGLLSSLLPKSYQTSGNVIYNPSNTPLQPAEAASTQRQLATFQSLVQTTSVIDAAAHQLSESASSLKSAIGVAVNENANILTISATAPHAKQAAARVNAVARAFIAQQNASQNLGLTTAESQLRAQIAQLRGTPESEAEIAALQSRISALQISAAGTASSLQLAGPATVPTSPSSPHPARNAIVALFVGLLIGVLIVLSRDQLRPHFATPRELGHALGTTVLTGVPYRPSLASGQRRRALSGLEQEAYDVLQASVRLLGSDASAQRVLLVTSAIHGEGKTTVTASLGRSLARAGQRTLVISGDLRSPSLHEQLGLPAGPGLAECLLAARQGDVANVLGDMIREVPGDLNLDVLLAGRTTPSDPSSLMSGPELGAFCEAVRALDYQYVLIDSPPALGLSDTQFLARQVDDVLLVARLDRVSPSQAEDVRELLRRLRITPIGLVAVGARVELSPYYTSERAMGTGRESGAGREETVGSAPS